MPRRRRATSTKRVSNATVDLRTVKEPRKGELQKPTPTKDDSEAHSLTCPSCKSRANNVIDSRPFGEGAAWRRRRECKACGHRFTTYEMLIASPECLSAEAKRLDAKVDEVLEMATKLKLLASEMVSAES